MLARSWFPGLLSMAVVVVGCGGTAPSPPLVSPPLAEAIEQGEVADTDESAAVHTDVELVILSRCPYASGTVRTLLDINEDLGRSLSIEVTYLGALDEQGEFTNLYGETEVQSAQVHVCAREVGERQAWFRFLQCAFEPEVWPTMPRNWPICAQRAGIDPAAVSGCLAGTMATTLLRRDYAQSAALNIVASPTVFFDGQPYWGGRSYDEMIRYLCHVTGDEQTRPSLCADIAPPPQIAATLLFDSRCTDAATCNFRQEITLLETLIPGLELARLDYASAQGKRLFDLIQLVVDAPALPLIVIDGALSTEKLILQRLAEYLVPFGSGYLLTMGSNWDPRGEICNNQIDDTGNGVVDCRDPSCAKAITCRKKEPRRLDLFIMSGCPFAAEMLPSVNRVIEHFSRQRSQVDLRLQFIGEVGDDGQIYSMHGPEEVQEDLRMICAQALYGEQYRFMDYVTCRATDFENRHYDACLPKWMSKKRLNRCVNGKQGKKLLKKSMALADRLGVMGSPTWLVNNHIFMEGRNANAIVRGFCEHNELAACDLPVAGEVESRRFREREPCCNP